MRRAVHSVFACLQLATATWLWLATAAHGAEVIPPAPPNHFNDFAGVVRRDTANRLNAELAQFERDTSNQILVAIYPKMQSDSSVDDYAVRVAQSWRAGQKERKNGAVLFLFQQTHDVYLATGYGLEGALPDALCKQIIENEMVPRFRAGDFDAGLTAGVHAIMAAARGEYRGTGRLATDARSGARGNSGGGGGMFFAFIVFIIVMSVFSRRARRGTVYGSRGRRGIWMGPGPWIGGGGFGGGNWGGGSSGGGTFSGGGGSFGGGGAGGRW